MAEQYPIGGPMPVEVNETGSGLLPLPGVELGDTTGGGGGPGGGGSGRRRVMVIASD